MSHSDHHGEPAKKVPLQVDLYGIKGDVAPRPDKEKPPTSWKETFRRVNCHLMRFCASTFGLAADIPDGLRAVVRGVAKLPGVVSSRIRRAHHRVDRRLEGDASQTGAVATAVAIPESLPPEEVIEQFSRTLDAFRARGVAVEQTRLPTGQWVVTLVQPGLERAALNAARKMVGDVTIDAHGPKPGYDAGSHHPIFDLNLPKRLHYSLNNAGYRSIEQIVAAGPEMVSAIPGIGPKSLACLRESLRICGQPWPEGD